MFIYKNHRVHVAGLSFAIPDECILNWMNTEVEIEGFSALTPDGKIKISLLPEIYLKGMKNEGAKERFEDLMALFKDGTYTFHTDITPIHKYGLDGYSLVSSSVLRYKNPFPCRNTVVKKQMPKLKSAEETRIMPGSGTPKNFV